MFALRTPAPHHRTANPAHPSLLDLPALAGAAAWARLPAAVQRRFGAAHADAVYQGRMDMRCSAIGHLFATLARLWGGPLTHHNATAVPTTVRVSSDGVGGVVWERRFDLRAIGSAGDGGNISGEDRTVRSTKELGADGRLLERTDGGLSMSLDVLEERGALVFRSRRFWWLVGRLRIAVPALLTPGTCTVTHTDLGDGLFRFTLSMEHPWWGETFYQSGLFMDPHTDNALEADADRHGDSPCIHSSTQSEDIPS